MSTEQFVAALTEYRLDPTEIAEVLWLALRQPQNPRVDEAPELVAEDEAVTPLSMNDDAGAQGDEIEDDWAEPDGDTADDSQEEEEPVYDLAPELPSGALLEKALPISVPDANILYETLPLIRAMKPLLKQIESQMLSRVNETETVERIAETDIWSPVLDPDQEPWFEVALVIDSSPAMRIWQRLIQDIQRLLRCYGSFRDFRVWQLTVVDSEPGHEVGHKLVSHQLGICAAADADAVTRSPRALLTPDARRLILVFSDCTANYWWDGSMQPILSLWGASTPTALWQVLPDWMWKRTALGVGEYVTVRNRIPGARNSKLTPVFLSLRSVARRGRQQAEPVDESLDDVSLVPVCVPVVTSEGKALRDWSRMLAGDRQYSTPGFLLPVSGWRPAPSPDADGENERQPQEDLLETFRLRATPSARRLAALLSAAPVITLPVMRLIRSSDELLPGSSPLPVAEVFLGGLLQKVPDQPADADPEQVQYTFPKEVREQFLDILPEVDVVEIIEAVSKYVAAQMNCTLADFRALLLSPDLKAEADRYGLRAFANMTATILKQKGGFDELVRQLESTPDDEPDSDDSGSEKEADSADWLEGFTHATLTYQVAEYLNFPVLEPFSFEECEFVEEEITFPPLSTEEFTIRTLERQAIDNDPFRLSLEPFEVMVPTLVRVGRQWQMQTQQRTARRFVEVLSADGTQTGLIARALSSLRGRSVVSESVPLEMAAIPGGRFLMGAPDDESERLNAESPQHEVSVEPFLMGRYPVTQAQWQVVAAMPQVERSLKSDPSIFKGEKLPVENISWHDAVEFCARLSAHTGRDYRLPTEAEWEYACRAGTSSAFHFGEMITTEVANYGGRAYADGPRGRSRNQTIHVDQLGTANAYGLSDMHGNVWEWCEDHYGSYGQPPTDGSAFVTNDEEARRVLRGGSWYSIPRNCRSACRNDYSPDHRDFNIGFRVSCSAPRTLV